MRRLALLPITCLLLAFQCSKEEDLGPACPTGSAALAAKIAELQAKPKRNPAYTI